MFRDWWSVPLSEGRIERVVEAVGVGDEERDGGSEAGSERGDEAVDEFERDRSRAELFDA